MTSCKVKEFSAILVHSSRPMVTNTHLITFPFISSQCIEIPQYEKSVSPGALFNHRLERGIEGVIHAVITRLIAETETRERTPEEVMTP